MDNQQGPTIEHMELCSILYGSQDGGELEDGYTYMISWVPLMFALKYHNTVDRLSA